MDKKYSRSELYTLCKLGNVKQICEELYDALYVDPPYPVMRSGDRFIMNKLREKMDKLIESEKNASIVIIHNDIPCLVIHRENDEERKSILSIMYPFQSKDDICGIIYKVHDVRNILDTLSYDDMDNRVCLRCTPSYMT